MKKIIVITIAIIISWLLVCLTLYKGKIIDYFIIPVLIGIVAGFVTNILHSLFEEKNRLFRLKKVLTKYVGNYDVYHLRDLSKPDACNYKMSIRINEKTGSLSIKT